mgnify:CR=1 FL=1
MALEVPTTAEALSSALMQGFQDAVASLIAFVPSLIFAVILFLIGWGIAVVAARIVKNFLKFVSLEKFLKERRLSDALGEVTLSNVLEKLTKYYILLVFLQASVAMLSLGTISVFLNGVLAFAPLLIGAALLLVVAAIVGELFKVRIIEMGKAAYLELVGSGVKFVIVFLGLVAALQTVGFDVSIFEQTFLTLLNGLVIGIALAFAIAFGLGGQNEAKDMIKTMRSKLDF